MPARRRVLAATAAATLGAVAGCTSRGGDDPQFEVTNMAEETLALDGELLAVEVEREPFDHRTDPPPAESAVEREWTWTWTVDPEETRAVDGPMTGDGWYYLRVRTMADHTDGTWVRGDEFVLVSYGRNSLGFTVGERA